MSKSKTFKRPASQLSPVTLFDLCFGKHDRSEVVHAFLFYQYLFIHFSGRWFVEKQEVVRNEIGCFRFDWSGPPSYLTTGELDGLGGKTVQSPEKACEETVQC